MQFAIQPTTADDKSSDMPQNVGPSKRYLERAIALLLNKPQLALSIELPNSIKQQNNSIYLDILVLLYNSIKEYPNITTAGLLNLPFSTIEKSLINKLCRWQPTINSVTQLSNELNHCYHKCHLEILQSQINKLIQKSQSIELNPTEKEKLQQLLHQHKESVLQTAYDIGEKK